MTNVRDVTWRFISVAPITAGQAALDDLFAETLNAFGVDRFDCVRVFGERGSDPPGFISDRGLSAWNQYFFEQGYHQIDPCLVACERNKGAYTWTDMKATAQDPACSRMWEDARAGGMREALIVPLAPRRPTGAVVRLVTPERRFNPDVLPLLQSVSVIYGSATQSFSAKGLETWPERESADALSDREIECLHWSARGKTNWEIGEILQISRHTVNTHIENAKRKLGVATGVQAAAMAHRLGLLTIA